MAVLWCCQDDGKVMSWAPQSSLLPHLVHARGVPKLTTIGGAWWCLQMALQCEASAPKANPHQRG